MEKGPLVTKRRDRSYNLAWNGERKFERWSEETEETHREWGTEFILGKGLGMTPSVHYGLSVSIFCTCCECELLQLWAFKGY